MHKMFPCKCFLYYLQFIFEQHLAGKKQFTSNSLWENWLEILTCIYLLLLMQILSNGRSLDFNEFKYLFSIFPDQRNLFCYNFFFIIHGF